MLLVKTSLVIVKSLAVLVDVLVKIPVGQPVNHTINYTSFVKNEGMIAILQIIAVCISIEM